MRIALVSDTYLPQVNGVTTVVRRMVDALDSARHSVAIVAPEYPGQQPEPGSGELRVPSMAFPPYPAIRLSVPAHRHVTHFLDDFRPDLVHVITEGPLGLVGRRYAGRRKLPLVTSYHTHFPRYCREYGVPGLEPMVWKWMRWFHAPAIMTQTPGDEARDQLIEHGVPNAVVWGRGVNTTRFHPQHRNAGLRRHLGAGENDVLVLHVGRLAAEKNIGVLADAFAAAQAGLGAHARFVIAGEGPMRETLMRRLPFAVFEGFLPAGRLAALYASADICVLPSHTETCGLVALEAMASGVPVIAADAGGLRESVRHGVTGLRVPADHAPAFASAICELVFDASQRHRLGAQSRTDALSRDSAIEDADLLRHYARILGHEQEIDTWRAAS